MASPKPKDKALYEKTKERTKKKFDVYPSVYANSWLVSEYKKAYKKKHGSDNAYEGKKPEKGGLPKWFEEEWVDLSRSDFEKDKWVECGRPDTGQTKADWKKKYPKCLPKAKAKKLWKEGGKKAWDSAVSRKQKAVSKKSYKGGKPTYVATKAAENLNSDESGIFGMRSGVLTEAGVVGASFFVVGAAMMQFERKGITDTRWWPYLGTFVAGASLHLIYEALGLNKKYCETAFQADEIHESESLKGKDMSYCKCGTKDEVGGFTCGQHCSRIRKDAEEKMPFGVHVQNHKTTSTVFYRRKPFRRFRGSRHREQAQSYANFMESKLKKNPRYFRYRSENYEAEEKPTEVEVKRSTNKQKKLMAVFTYPDGKTTTTHFGARGMSDYTKHGDEERMERYLARHDNDREDWTDPTTAGALSRWILWNKPSLSASFNDFKKRFNLKGDLKVKKSAESFESDSNNPSADSYEIIIPDGNRVGYKIIKALDKDMIDWEQVEGRFRIINGEKVGYHIIRKLNKAGIDWFPVESFESEDAEKYVAWQTPTPSSFGYRMSKYHIIGNGNRTLCGKEIGYDSYTWPELSFAQSGNLCKRCEKKDMRAETFDSETVAFESFRGRWNVGQTRDIEGVRVKKMWNGAFRLDFQGESTIIRDGIFYQINRSRTGRFSMGERDRQLNRELRRTGYSEKDEPDNMEAIIRWKHKIGGGRLVIRSPFKKARHIFAGGLYSFTLPGQRYSGVFYPTNRGKTYRFIRRNGEPIVGRFPNKNEAWLDIRYDSESFQAQFTPSQELSDYTPEELVESSAIDGYQPLKYSVVGNRAESFDAEMSCPPATQDAKINAKNQKEAFDKFGYGPRNVKEPGNFWKNMAKEMDKTVAEAKKSKCGNCVAFDVSPRMKDCGVGKQGDDGVFTGYCWMHHFTCQSERTCNTWAKGGPIRTNKDSEGWQERAFGAEELEKMFDGIKQAHKHYGYGGSHRTGSIVENGVVVRSYSNNSGKDKVSENFEEISYRIKDDKLKDAFKENQNRNKDLRFFLKTKNNKVADLGMYGVKNVSAKNVKLEKKTAESFESETVAFESFTGRWNVGQTKEVEGVQVTKLSSGRGAGFRMEYDGHVGEIVADDERRDGVFFVFEGGGLGSGGRYDGISGNDQRECLIRWKHKVGGGTLVIKSPFKKARAILSKGRYRPYSGVFRPPSEAFSKANTFLRKSDGRVQMGRPPRKNEKWLGIRYDSESFESQDTTTLSCGHTLVLGADDIHYGDSERPMTCPICVDNLRKYDE